MIKKINSFLHKLFSYLRNEKDFETLLLNQGKLLSAQYCQINAAKLSSYEWKIFSQWGEDGIIDFLVSEVPIANKTFIEFGIEDFSESNCRFLLMNADWHGFVIDGSAGNINRLKNRSYFWKHDLQAIAAFVDAENINGLLSQSGFERDLGILSVDIDGNDYHVLSAINGFEPRIIICEFNPVFGAERKISVPYDPNFYRTDKHHSNLYFGASINAFKSLLDKRGYTLVGTGMLGGNAFFVKNELLTDRLKALAKDPYCFNFNFRESRDADGNLSFLRGAQRYDAIQGMAVLNVETGTLELL